MGSTIMAEANQPGEPAAPPPAAIAPGPPPVSGIAVGPPPEKPPAPPRPVAQTPQGPTRRNFAIAAVLALFGSWFAAAWTTFTLSMIGMTLGTVRFMFPNVLSEPPS